MSLNQGPLGHLTQMGSRHTLLWWIYLLGSSWLAHQDPARTQWIPQLVLRAPHRDSWQEARHPKYPQIYWDFGPPPPLLSRSVSQWH